MYNRDVANLHNLYRDSGNRALLGIYANCATLQSMNVFKGGFEENFQTLLIRIYYSFFHF